MEDAWKGGTAYQKSRGRRRARDKSDAGNKAKRRKCVLSDEDITELKTVYDFCRERIVENQNFNVIFHELMSRPHKWTFNISDRFNLPLEVRDRKYLSYYGRTSNPGFGDDEGNVYLRLVFVGLCLFLKCLPVQWTYHFPKGEEYQGDAIEAVLGIVDPVAPTSADVRQFVYKQYRICLICDALNILRYVRFSRSNTPSF